MDDLEFKNDKQTDFTENKVTDNSSVKEQEAVNASPKDTIWQSYYARQEASQGNVQEQPAASATTGNSYVSGQGYQPQSTSQTQGSVGAYTTSGATTSYSKDAVSADTANSGAAATGSAYQQEQTSVSPSSTAYTSYTQNQYTPSQTNSAQNRQSYTSSSYGNTYGAGTQYTANPQQAAQQSSATRQVYQANTARTASGQYGGAQPPNNTGSGFSGYSSQPPYANSSSPKKPKKQKKTLRGVALVLVCLVAGFGGSVLGNNVSQKEVSTKVTSSIVASGISSETSKSASSISDIAAKAGVSVVSIITENLETNPFTGGQVVSGAGSGVIMSEDGYIITNNHVVEGAQTVSVSLSDGTQYPATIIGTDATSDIAVIKIDMTGLSAATFSDSSQISVGDFCMAIGNPMGVLSGTVTDGIISALDREITVQGNAMTLLQMSAAVSPGNSGGGLFNDNGDLIGIVNAKSSGDSSEGLGFAIPANTALEVATALIENGHVVGRPSIGISVVEVTDSRSVEGYSAPGVYVAEVSSGGAGEKAGLQKGDRIISVDGESVSETLDISKVLSQRSAGDTISVEISRNGEVLTVSVVLQDLNG